jgi:hypothetical protein
MRAQLIRASLGPVAAHPCFLSLPHHSAICPGRSKIARSFRYRTCRVAIGSDGHDERKLVSQAVAIQLEMAHFETQNVAPQAESRVQHS